MKKVILFLTLLSLLAGECLFKAASNDLSPQRLTRQSNQGRGIVELAQTLKALSNPYSLLSVATTLDDIDFAVLAYYHQKLGAHISLVLATRGDGGKDRPPDASTEDLAIEETHKTLRAAQAIDADVYFLDLPNARSLASAEEVLGHWGKEEAAKKMRQAIRSIRPDAIISNHDPKTGDAQQQALGRLLIEAFDSAADTKTATAADSEAWQARRLFLRTDADQAEVLVGINEFDSLRGTTYAQAVWPDSDNARQKPPQAKSFYRLALSATGEQKQVRGSFFDGFSLPEKLRLSVAPPIVGSLNLMEALNLPEKLVEALTEKLIEIRAEGSIATLRQRYGREYFRVVRFTENLERAIALALGIDAEMTLPDMIIAQGETVKAQVSFHNASNHSLSMVFHTPASLPVAGKSISYKTSEIITVAPATSVSQELSYETAKDARLTLPHSQHLFDEGFYTASVLRHSRQPFGNLLFAYAEVNLGQTTLTLPVLQRFDVAKPFEITVAPSFAFVKDWSQAREVEVIARIRKRLRTPFSGALWVVPVALQAENYEPLHLTFTTEDEEAIIRLKLKLPIMRPPLAPDILLELRREKPAAPVALAAIKIPVKLLDCAVTEGLKVGFLANGEAALGQALAVLGVESTALSVEEIAVNEHGVKGGEPVNQVCAHLARFDTVIVDALFYSQNANLLAKNSCLLEYARRGGNLVVFYQRPGFWSSVFNRNLFAPFPIQLSNEKIVNKNAAFKLLDGEHRLLAKPNKIDEKDFQDYAKHLALYLPKAWSSDYQALLELSNANQETQKGSLLFARYGEGTYIYVSLDVQAQLLEANPGACRLFANLISLPKVLKEPSQR